MQTRFDVGVGATLANSDSEHMVTFVQLRSEVAVRANDSYWSAGAGPRLAFQA